MTGEQDDIESLAGEYVLGLLSEAEGEAFERRLESDAALRRAVRDARDRFHELDATAPTAAAPDGLWQRIESRLDGGAGGTVMAFRAKPRTTLRTAAFWKGVAAACIVGAIALPLSWQAIAPPKPELVVVLLDRRSNPGAIVEAFGDRRIRVVPLERFEVPPGKTLQVWTLPNRETGPVSMGLLHSASAIELTGPVLPPPKPNQLYEITLEPAGGSPTGRPTGPVMAKGFARVPQI